MNGLSVRAGLKSIPNRYVMSSSDPRMSFAAQKTDARTRESGA